MSDPHHRDLPLTEAATLRQLIDRLEAATHRAEMVAQQLERIAFPTWQSHPPQLAAPMHPAPSEARAASSQVVAGDQDRSRPPIRKLLGQQKLEIFFSAIAAVVAIIVVFILFYGR